MEGIPVWFQWCIGLFYAVTIIGGLYGQWADKHAEAEYEERHRLIAQAHQAGIEQERQRAKLEAKKAAQAQISSSEQQN